MRIKRLRLYASTCRLISVPTRGSVRVRKWLYPIQCLIVPNVCSTVCRRTLIISGFMVEPALHIVDHAFMIPAPNASKRQMSALRNEWRTSGNLSSSTHA